MAAATTDPKTNGKAPETAAEPFPCESFRDAAKHLRRPFTPAAVKFKPQSVLGDEGKGVLCVAYIDARLVYERLNLVVPHLWQHNFRSVGDGLMWCDLTIDGITRPDVGEGKGKALASDALKRAAVTFGVGVSLYAVPSQRIWKDTQGGKLVSIWPSGTKPNGKPKFDARLEEPGQAHLRGIYEHWLEAVGIKAFGEPLDHGDVIGAQGDHEADDTPAPDGVDPTTGEITGPPDELVAEMEGQARDLVERKVWTGRSLKANLVAAGATDTSSVGVALRTLTVEQATELRDAMAALLAPKPEEAAA